MSGQAAHWRQFLRQFVCELSLAFDAVERQRQRVFAFERQLQEVPMTPA